MGTRGTGGTAGAADPDGGSAVLAGDVQRHLQRLAALARQAEAAPQWAQQAAALIEAQQAAALGLQATVVRARQRGVTWRELAKVLGVPASTLHHQYRSEPGVSGAAPELRAAGQPGTETAPWPPELVPPAGPGAACEYRNDRPALPLIGLDRLVGRDAELADLPRMLAGERLVTLTGPAGVGKTRLAAELVHRARGAYRHGRWWADLAPLPEGSLVAPTVLAAANVREEPGRDLTELIAAAGAGGPVLLVLDNCEHVLAGCAAVVQRLLTACPRLRVLATSREPLLIPGETVFAVAPLLLPDAGTMTAEEIRLTPAVRLFTDRACALVSGFELTDQLVPVVAQLCTQLDGLPLAIELAARQVGVLPPRELLRSLDDTLGVLSGGFRTAPPRQQSLHAAIEWSYELLAEPEQAVFRRLSVLPGGFGHHGAAALCADLSLSPAEAWQIVTRLARKSLLTPDRAAGRFRLLESLRAFSRDRLAAAGELGATCEALLAWLTHHAEILLTIVSTPHETASVIDAERDNLRSAVEIAYAGRDERQLLLTVALAWCGRRRGELQQSRALLERALSQQPDPSPTRIVALDGLAQILALQGDYGGAKRYAREAMDMADQLGDAVLARDARYSLIMAHHNAGDAVTAIALSRQLIEMLRRLDQPHELGLALNSLAYSLLLDGQVEAAAGPAEEALQLVDAPAHPAVYATVLHTAGAVARASGRADAARDYFTAGLSVAGTVVQAVLENMEGLALAIGQDEPERALHLLAAAGAARTSRRLRNAPWLQSQIDDALAAARGRLPRSAGDVAITTGEGLTLEQATAYALSGQLPAKAASDGGLTGRERQVAELAAAGLTNPQVAARLGISARTVASHLTHIRAKLDLPTRAHLVTWVTRQQRDPGGATPAG